MVATQTIQPLRIKHSDPETRDRQLSATVAAMVGIGPNYELEGMFAAQLLATHNATMECYRRAMIGEQTFEGLMQLPLHRALKCRARTSAEAIARRREIATMLRAMHALARAPGEGE